MVYLRGLVVAGIILGVFGYYFYNVQEEKRNESRHSLIDRMEQEGVINITGEDVIRGGQFNLESLRGKVVILNFWASWCEPCAKELPDMLKLVEENKPNVALVAISADEEREEMLAFLKAFGGMKSESSYVLWDPKKEIAGQFEV